jgi:hypothetical protein
MEGWANLDDQKSLVAVLLVGERAIGVGSGMRSATLAR